MSAEVTAATSAMNISDAQAEAAGSSSPPAVPVPAPSASSTVANAENSDGNAGATDSPAETGTPAPVPAPGTSTNVLSPTVVPNTSTTTDIPNTETEVENSPVHNEAPQEGPLAELGKNLTNIIIEARHQEMWGIDLTSIRDVPTCIVLQKFLKANGNDPNQAAEQLKKALEWRKEFRPLATLQERHSREKFEGLGFITHHTPPNDVDDTPATIITWNIYGGVKDRKTTFSDVDEFCRWRVSLMEQAIQGLKIDEATATIPDDGKDTYRIIQVHDYLDISFLRLDPNIKAASKQVIDTFQTGYPELLEHKYFVNVPYVMNWIFNFFKLFLSKETVSKFHPMAKGTMLANELPAIVDTLPGAYGGRSPDLKNNKSAICPRMTTKEEQTATEPAPETTASTREPKGAEPGNSEKSPTEGASAATADKSKVAE
ncbi:hypothetical protein MKZ38_001336 [Zalerion maritima]|uniref:Phosphatidylinositol transfer protein SFH5 n=1 Tax=Zalerion maritima TaxID=339359 RepID=A0AAD5RQH9_9PEZI|nr:hypothetical protein MKZ38_001336 [Zalerion maritima]